ncbi:hypothetical protein EHQ43_17540 [Leptospira bouyouniensis]|uniref:Uncharacterized protein n=1 Tax=Leptospira bouyouniensis TaxID=2484911 RepID=A0A7I0HPN3_9LEPT|nr:hypothetical protein [Leptospira bouyouniensis]TGL03556.1 hypothetical protein EHQ43_17540 [Leptospira bouyouniensis]
MPTQFSTLSLPIIHKVSKAFPTNIPSQPIVLPQNTARLGLNALINEFDKVRIQYQDIYFPLQITISSKRISAKYTLKFTELFPIVDKAIKQFEKYLFKKHYRRGLSIPKLVWRGTGSEDQRRDHYHILILLPLQFDLKALLLSFISENYDIYTRSIDHDSRADLFIKDYTGSSREFLYYVARSENEEAGIDKLELGLSNIYGQFSQNIITNHCGFIHNTISRCQLAQQVTLHREALSEFGNFVNASGIDRIGSNKQYIHLPSTYNHPIKRLSNEHYTYVTLNEARREFVKTLTNTLNSNDKNIHLIIAVTGIGKSYQINRLDELLINECRVLIVSPRHDTINEYSIGEKLPEIPNSLKEVFDISYRFGISPKKALKQSNCSNEQRLLLKIELADYEARTNTILNDSPIVHITHARYLLMSQSQLAKWDIIVIDEDIMNTLLSPRKLPIGNLEIVLSKLTSKVSEEEENLKKERKKLNDIKSVFSRNSDDYILSSIDREELIENLAPIINKIPNLDTYIRVNEPKIKEKEEELKRNKKLISKLNRILLSAENEPLKTPYFSSEMIKDINLEIDESVRKAFEQILEEEDVTEDYLQSTLSLFLKSKNYQKSEGFIEFIPMFKFTNQKIIILTATPLIIAYERLAGDRLVTHRISTPELKATIIQDASRSLSRHSLKNKFGEYFFNDLIDSYIELGYSAISYKDSHRLLSAHFGATTSLRSLEGKNLLIAGTPNVRPETFRLQSAYLGLNYKSVVNYNEAIERKPNEGNLVTFNGYSFPFITLSDDEEITRFQLTLIDAELLQAMGRIRPYQYLGTIFILSKLPIVGAKFL